MARRKKENQPSTARELTIEESLKILMPLVKKEDFIKFGDHSLYPYRNFGPNVFRLIVNVMSLDMLISIMEHPQVENVYFTPTAPPPDFAVDGITMAYKLYVKYKKIID